MLTKWSDLSKIHNYRYPIISLILCSPGVNENAVYSFWEGNPTRSDRCGVMHHILCDKQECAHPAQ